MRNVCCCKYINFFLQLSGDLCDRPTCLDYVILLAMYDIICSDRVT